MEKLEPILSCETQGFVHLPGVLEPAFLARLKAAFDRAVAKHAQKWIAAGEATTPSFNIPQILNDDEVFVDLVDVPTVFPLLVEILGYDIRLMIAQARLFRPFATFVPPWHSDLDEVRGSSNFGSITSTRFPNGDFGSARQLQLALKLQF